MIKRTISAITMTAIALSTVMSVSRVAAQDRMVTNDYWWPNRLHLDPLRKTDAASNPLGDEFDYAQAFESLDLEAVKADLVELMNSEQRRLEQLTVEQEQELVDDKTLLAVAICALNRWTMDEIVAFYDMTAGQCFQKLAKLDRLKLIDLLPNNRIKLLIAPNFRWQDNGPIQKLFQERLGPEFLRGRFDGDNECLIVLNGMLSQQNSADFQDKLRRLAWEFEAANREDSTLPLAQRRGLTTVLAVRGWQYGLFHPLRKASGEVPRQPPPSASNRSSSP